MKKILAFVLACFCSASAAPAVSDGYKELFVIATAPDVFMLPEGSTIQIYNDVLMVNETYIILIDVYNDNEILNYFDLETYELMKSE
jgi:hypothetical protein